MRRQEGLYLPGKVYRVLIWESAPNVLIRPQCCEAIRPAFVAAGLDTVELGIVPLATPVKIAAGDDFWILDGRLVIAETWHAEMWLDSSEDVARYSKVWDTLARSAAYGHQVHHLIMRARTNIGLL